MVFLSFWSAKNVPLDQVLGKGAGGFVAGLAV